MKANKTDTEHKEDTESTGGEEKGFLIPESLLANLLNYLYHKPYSEVAGFITLLNKAINSN